MKDARPESNAEDENVFTPKPSRDSVFSSFDAKLFAKNFPSPTSNATSTRKSNFIYPEDLSFQETSADTISSICLLGKRILRQYSSEFILPDNTRVGVNRRETTYPAEAIHTVIVSLEVGLPRLKPNDNDDQYGSKSYPADPDSLARSEPLKGRGGSESTSTEERTMNSCENNINELPSNPLNTMISESSTNPEMSSGASEYEHGMEDVFCDECEHNIENYYKVTQSQKFTNLREAINKDMSSGVTYLDGTQDEENRKRLFGTQFSSFNDDKEAVKKVYQALKKNAESKQCPECINLRSNIKRTQCAKGLRIADYLDDDLWAASLLECDASTNGDLLRQLEAGCRLDPSAYKMERRQRRRNWETLVCLDGEPQIRSIGLSRTNSETDSIATVTTLVDGLAVDE